MTFKNILSTIGVISFITLAFTLSQSNENNKVLKTDYVPSNGFVPDETTAITIAEAIWNPIYGEKSIASQKPFDVELINDSTVWIVQGNREYVKGYKGGGAYIAIQRSDCKILRVTHGK